MRLIDADALKKVFHAEWDDVLVWDESGETTADQFCNIVDAAPTIEAEPTEEQIQKYILDHNLTHKVFEPVKRGKWNIYRSAVECSVCKHAYYKYWDDVSEILCPPMNYCPNCGAKMSEGSEE